MGGGGMGAGGRGMEWGLCRLPQQAPEGAFLFAAPVL